MAGFRPLLIDMQSASWLLHDAGGNVRRAAFRRQER